MLDLSPTILLPLAALLGLCLGSFLNVVIVRLPVMLMLGWRSEAREALELPEEQSPRFNLLVPRSICPQCETPIAWHDNLPVLGWIKRRGRCAACEARISPQYPLVELAGAGLALAVVALYGASWQGLFMYGACLALLALAVIDLRTQLLPDAMTLPLLWAGLLYQLLFQPLMLPSAVIGAMAGYLALWSVYWLFKLVTGKEGMGYGDFKLLAALGAWLGWQYLPMVLILSAGVGAIVGIALQLALPRLRGAPMPFGPYLASAGMIALLVGEPLVAAYIGFTF
ncbi:prepilin peptidase [Halomonas daqingensis]|uniref:Prepilin leader peptidase/N-methyltransferase n=1 Tax=Billgrantia desiderata TaxID=52021 RepID=A0ABS9AZP7_9GAMM|nr:A24 family peptidase [Halomonas desiderata]MCE8040671.1 prepilin peptidase [Halomonas desiderata]MCE8045246.1 prepilin peptidase [Halomonas desiderata]